MANGTGSADNAPLSRETIDRRCDTLRDFLTFACAKALRPAPDGNGPVKELEPARPPDPASSARRRPPKNLRLPTTSELARWLLEVHTRCGPTRALACRSVIQTGMRLEEVELVRADQVPPLDDHLCERQA